MNREICFECSYCTASSVPECEVYLRAWSDAEAEMLFRELLSAAGLRVPGTIRIHAPGGQTRLAPYAPCS
jgi:hypothetical protein